MASCHCKCCSRGKHAVRLKPNTTGALSIFYVAGAWKGARKNEAREGDTLLSCVFVARPVFSRFLLPSACYAELDDVCMQADT